MGLFSSIGKILAGGKRQKGETTGQYNERSHKTYVNDWASEKKRTKQWLPKEEYEKKTGKRGRKD